MLCNPNQEKMLRTVGATFWCGRSHSWDRHTNLASVRGHQVVSLFKNAGMYVVYLCEMHDQISRNGDASTTILPSRRNKKESGS
jgi:plastocyanin